MSGAEDAEPRDAASRPDQALHGWASDFPRFHQTPSRVVCARLASIIRDVSPQQIHAWDSSIPPLQREIGEVLEREQAASEYTAILEYELPLDARRPDVVLLVSGAVVVLELKGKLRPSQADLDQAAAYARDLRCYHDACARGDVFAVVVPTGARGYIGNQGGVHVVGPDALDRFITDLDRPRIVPPITPDRFLAADAYRPLPTLVKAARLLFETGDLPRIHRARAATDPTVDFVARIIHDAAATGTRRLVLLTGIPGSGKTLVGLRIVHAHLLDDLAVPRKGRKPTAPAVFLSGNGPLVEVLQYELRAAGGGGRTFVRGVKDYVRTHSRSTDPPPEHVLVFDEAQRAFDAAQVHAKHKNTPGLTSGRSEPEHFIEFAQRVPGWCTVIGLIGGGQEIHVGEEAGLVQWRHAIEGAARPSEWTVHGPPRVERTFEGGRVAFRAADPLELDREIRFHSASDLHRFVNGLLDGVPAQESRVLSDRLEADCYTLRLTRSLERAKAYLRDRYGEDPRKRFGIIASSKDRDLVRFGIANDYQSTKRIRVGPWYADPEDDPSGHSCRRLADCVTEFGAQGLELDAALLAWGTDLRVAGGRWTNDGARGYKRGAHVRDPFRLRVNAYRVLLTRGRDGSVVYVPPIPEMDETCRYLEASGFRDLDAATM